MKNSGQPIKLGLPNLSDSEREKIATEFSEGSERLKNLLLKMWSNNIETYACCVGHGGKSKAYLFFDVRNFPQNKLSLILKKSMELYKKDVVELTFSNNYEKEELFDRKGLSIYRKDETISTDDFFNIIDEILFGENISICVQFSKEEKEVINSVFKLYEVDMDAYINKSKNRPSHKYGHIEIDTFDKKFYTMVLNNVNYKIHKERDKNGKKYGYFVSEGYYAKTRNGEFYTLKGDKIVKINEDDVKNYKLFRFYKKYNFRQDFDVKVFNLIMEEIDEITCQHSQRFS